MRVNGFQFYWLIAIGLLVGLVLGIAIGVTGELRIDNFAIGIPLLAAFLYASVSGLVVWLEIWDRFGFAAALAALIFVPALVVYWFSRMHGVDLSDEPSSH